LAYKIPQSPIDPTSFIANTSNDSIVITPTEPTEILNILRDIKTIAEGWDGLSSKTIKSVYPLICHPLTHIVNLLISQGVVPSELKKAIIHPIFKKDDPRKLTNYRPISILPLFSKVIEKVMYKRIYHFLTQRNLLYDYQFGFRQKYNTNLALIQIVDKLMQTLSKNESAIGVFLDFSKAFDTIDHKILLSKLDKYGIRGIGNQWIKDYLSNRRQSVKFKSSVSPELQVECGVPQVAF
jgi:hypothetical protein